MKRSPISRKPNHRKDGTSLMPIHVDRGWFYETSTGLEIYIPSGGTASIPFRVLAASLRRIAKARGVRL